MNALVNDLRHALRTLRRTPGFTAVAALTLAVGIGANTAIFGLVDAILIRPLPYRDAERLVSVRLAAPGLDLADTGLSDATYLHYRRHNRVFDDIAFSYENVVNLVGDGEAERVPVALVSHSFFATLGAEPAVGRLFAEADGRPDAEVVVVISHDLWRRRFGSDPAIVGHTVQFNNVRRRVIGVVERGFGFPRRDTDIWFASDPDPARAGLSDFYYSAVARLRPGVSAEAAEADLNRLIPSLADAFPRITAERVEASRLRAIVEPLKDVIVGDVDAALWLLLGGMGFVLLIACANVANLFLVRAEHRQREVAVRVALGARGGDLARYFAGEGLLLAAMGGALGLALAWAGVEALVAFGPAALPRLHEVGVDLRVAGFAAALSVGCGLLFGAVPLLRHARAAPAAVLKEGTHGATAAPERQRARRLLVGTQVALALVLLVSSVLMVQSFWRLKNVDAGFDSDGVLTLEIALPATTYLPYARAADFWDELLERVRALPGVAAAGGVSALPLLDLPAYYDVPLAVEGGRTGPAIAPPMATFHFVTPGYFEALGIPTTSGRVLRPGDRPDASAPVYLSAALARRLFPKGGAIGRRVRRAQRRGDAWNTVAAVVGDVPAMSVVGEPTEILYLPVLEQPADSGLVPLHLSLAIRAGVPPASLAPVVRRVVRELDPNLPLANVRTMERIVADSMARTSFAMALLLVAATAALFLGAVGIYGVISYVVGRRTHEIGVRIALGARPADVRRLVVRQGVRVTFAGLAVGALAALWLTRFLSDLLYEVSPTDPLAIAAMAGLLLGVALLASWIPARRAARVDPMTALRTE